MKKRYGIILLAISCVAAISCSRELKTDEFSVDTESIEIGAEGGEQTVRITSSSEWVAMASEPWISVSPANGNGDVECSIRIDSSLVVGVRDAVVRFSSEGHEALKVKVDQFGFGNIIKSEFTEKTIENTAVYDQRYFKVDVTANVDFDVVVETPEGEDWISVGKYSVNLDRKSRPRRVSLKMNWKMNPNPEQRTATVKFVPKDASVKLDADAVLTVTQKAAPRIEDNRAGDSLALLTITEKLQGMTAWDPAENMMHWSDVELWSEGEKDLPAPDAVGRVKAVRFFIFSTKETVPSEVKHLKYAETISFYGNTNTMYLNIDLGADICSLEHLKNLQIAAYGLVSLPEELTQMKQLEVLDLNSNNFSRIPQILTPENFPNLKELNLGGQRRWLVTDLRNKDNSRYEGGIGMYLDLNTEEDSNALKALFRWEKLEYLSFTYSYLEGPLPDFKIGEDGVEGYTEQDAIRMGLRDTIKFLYDPAFITPAGAPKGTDIPKILPNMKSLRININFFNGKLPDWVLYHPHFMDWTPDTFIFSQQDRGIDMDGRIVGFTNVPSNFEYYYAAFPYYRQKYYISEETTEEE